MKLTKVRIKNYKCIHDSTEFDIDDITCLVGKNESGKTAILEALHKFNPFDPTDPVATKFDRSRDYPKEDPKSENDVVEATFSLEREDIEAIENFITCKCVNGSEPTITLPRGYSADMPSVVKYDFDVDLDAIIKKISTTTKIKANPSVKDPTKLANDLLTQLDSSENDHYYRILEQITSSDIRVYIFSSILHERIPQFIYLDQYPQMRGVMSINGLSDSIKNNQIQPVEEPIVKILSLAGVNYDVLINAQSDNEHGIEIKKAQNALNKELNKILKSWSQHKIYCMESEILSSNLSIYIRDRRNDEGYLTRKPFESESHGFLWFFSFLMMQKHFYQDNNDVILLLDEPGLSLHAKAQKDLLQFFEDELASRHQVIYTTHSPFLIDLGHLNRVRIVKNKSLEEESDQLKYNESGTKISSEVHSADKDTLIPLQSALGYDISQGVFIGRNFLIVEGKSDEIYIKVVSNLLEKKVRGVLGPWNIVPANSIDKVASFIKLFGATGLNLAVLVDCHNNEKQKIENFSKQSNVDEDRVFTYADFTGTKEADVEDMFPPDFYLELVEKTYGISIDKAKFPKRSRIISRLESGVRFSHLKPATYLMENIESIGVPEEVLSRFQKVFNKLNERKRVEPDKVHGTVGTARPAIDFIEEKAAIQAVYRTFYKAFNDNDLKAIGETFRTNDGKVAFGTIFAGNEPMPVAFGWTNVKAAIEGLWIGIGTKGAKWGQNDKLTDFWIRSKGGKLEAAVIGYNCYKGAFPGETHLYLVKEVKDGWKIHELDSSTENNLGIFGFHKGKPRLKEAGRFFTTDADKVE